MMMMMMTVDGGEQYCRWTWNLTGCRHQHPIAVQCIHIAVRSFHLYMELRFKNGW